MKPPQEKWGRTRQAFNVCAWLALAAAGIGLSFIHGNNVAIDYGIAFVLTALLALIMNRPELFTKPNTKLVPMPDILAWVGTHPKRVVFANGLTLLATGRYGAIIFLAGCFGMWLWLYRKNNGGAQQQ